MVPSRVVLELILPRSPARLSYPIMRRGQCFDWKTAHPATQDGFDWIKPIVEKLFFCRPGGRFPDIFFHDVISIGVGAPIRVV